MGGSSFEIAVDDATLVDLHDRLRRTRFANRSDLQAWQAGADPEYLRDLVATWAEGFDWRQREGRLNELPQYETLIGGRRMHFLQFRAVGARDRRPLPLILSHGWPSSFIEMVPLAERLSDPARFGGDPNHAVDVIVPSLPGFLFSEVPPKPLTRATIAEMLHTLMIEVLEYERYGAFGGDIGGAVVAWMAVLHPEHVVGIHMIHPPYTTAFEDSPPSDAEQAFLNGVDAYDETDGGYSSIMATRPDTIAAALIDSPVGLAAWIVDKYRDWSDCHGDLESRIDRDTLLTIITLYWVTGSVGTSFRSYYDFGHNKPRPMITVPAAFTLSNEPSLANFPRSLTERVCTDIRQWTEPTRGGHFLPLEEPARMAGELRQFFQSLG
jgi:pimeloyl-ACP methyl ester carboxylesterase